MLIRVVYKDLTFDFVKPRRLDEFLACGKIALFRRSSGWVFVGIDAIRAHNGSRCVWPERRRPPESV